MGREYTNHKMVGAYITGQMNDLYQFLKQNNYPITDKQKEEIDEGGQFDYDIVELLQLGNMQIVMLDSWSGHDFVIGYHIKKSMNKEKAKEEFAKYFPNVEAEYHNFTEVC